MNNDKPSQLPPISLVQPSIVEGVIPLPPTSLLGESEVTYVNRKSPGEPDPAEVKAREEAKTEFPIFEDNSFFKFLERPGHAPQCLIVSADGQQIAVVKNVDLADLICNALNLFLIASLKAQAEGERLQILTKPIILPGV